MWVLPGWERQRTLASRRRYYLSEFSYYTCFIITPDFVKLRKILINSLEKRTFICTNWRRITVNIKYITAEYKIYILTCTSTEEDFKNKTLPSYGTLALVAQLLHWKITESSPSLYFLYSSLSICNLLEQHRCVSLPQYVHGSECCLGRTFWAQSTHVLSSIIKTYGNLCATYTLYMHTSLCGTYLRNRRITTKPPVSDSSCPDAYPKEIPYTWTPRLTQ